MAISFSSDFVASESDTDILEDRGELMAGTGRSAGGPTVPE